MLGQYPLVGRGCSSQADDFHPDNFYPCQLNSIAKSSEERLFQLESFNTNIDSVVTLY